MITQERLKELLDYDPTSGVFTWRKSMGGWGAGREAGTIMFDGYIRIGLDKKQYPAHKLAWLFVHGEYPEELLDHRDTNRANNAIENLRKADCSKNKANSVVPRTNTSGFKGVSKIRESGLWLSTIKVNGRSRYLGTYATPEAAHAAYMKAAEAAWGEFARSA